MPSQSRAPLHMACFYRGPQQFLAHTVPFVLRALAVAEPVLVALPEVNLRLLRTELTAMVGPAMERVRMVDLGRHGRNPGWIIPGVLRPFLDAAPARPLSVVTEPLWPGRGPVEYPACVQHEALVNLAFPGRAVTILCPFDAMGLPDVALADITASHPALVGKDGALRDNGEYAPGRVLEAANRPLPEAPAGATAFEFRGTGLEELRAMVVQEAAQASLSPERAGEVEIAVNELAVNTLVHGGGSGTLGVWTQDGYLVCEVSDSGYIADPLVGRRSVDPTTPGGRGVLIVNHLADLVRMHTGPSGTTIRALFALPR